MSLRTEKVLSLTLWAIMAGFAVWGHFNLPDGPMAVHFDISGNANGFAPRDVAILMMPGVALGVALLMLWVLPTIMPKGLERSAAAYGAVTMAITALLTLIQAMLILSAAGMAIDHIKTVSIGVGVVFIILGNYLPKTRLNYVMGIRTPWTLSDERVWDKTHRFAGPLFMLGGALAIGAAFMGPQWHLIGLLGGVGMPVVASLAYSYLAAKKLNLV